jgi:pimeloyl-ACP methyl ester carboxylesterase
MRRTWVHATLMVMRRRLVLVCALAAVVLVGPARSAAPPPAAWLEACGERWCGELAVPENRAVPEGRQIRLNVVVVPATSPSLRSGNAIAFLAGGPGGAAASDGTANWFPGLIDDAVTKHDLLLVDQRGTGESNPLFCPLPTTIPSEPTTEQIRAWWTACLQGLDGDPRFYGTNDAADDLDDVRAALGYERLHLYGISYGVATAQAYLARHGERVATATLDSGVAFGTRPFQAWARSYQDVLDRLVDRCARAPRCRAAFPSPARDLALVLARLEGQPVRAAGVVVTADLFAGLVQVLTDGGARQASVLPLFLRTAAAKGVPVAVDRLGADLVKALTEQAGQPAKAMYFAIRCSEPWALDDPAETARLSAGTYLEDTMRRSTEQIAAICSVTPPLADVENLDAPVRSAVPALIAMGAEDPKLPARTIVALHAAMPNARVAVVRTAGHGTIGYRCIQRLADQLIVTGASAGLDTSCARQQSFPAFVLRWSDWSPGGG